MHKGGLSLDTFVNFTGKTVLVTGINGGIGSTIVRRFAEAGASLILHCRNDDVNLLPIKARLSSLTKGFVRAFFADLSDTEEIQSVIPNILEHHDSIDVLINNAAVQPVTALGDLDASEINEILSTNLKAPMLLTRDFARAALNGGVVINICSIEGLNPSFGHSHYAASKAGLIQFTRATALELGPQNIRANAICPGLISRNGIEAEWPEGVESWKNKVPLKRLGDPEDVANAALFLASDAASFISGACLTVDGGMNCTPGW